MQSQIKFLNLLLIYFKRKNGMGTAKKKKGKVQEIIKQEQVIMKQGADILKITIRILRT